MVNWQEAKARANAKLAADPDYPRREFIRKKMASNFVLFDILLVPISLLVARVLGFSEWMLGYFATGLAVYLSYSKAVSDSVKKFGKRQ